jgi:hypothetical protein
MSAAGSIREKPKKKDKRGRSKSADQGTRRKPRRDQSSAYVVSRDVLEKSKKLDIIERNMRIQEEYAQKNNGWNPELEDFVKGQAEQAQGFRWMHGECASYFNKFYQRTGLLAILLTTASAALNIPSITTCQAELDIYKGLALGFSFLTALVLAYQQFKNYGKRTSDHLKAESDFSALFNSIKQELSLNRRDRRFGKDYVEWITKDFDELKAASKQIPASIAEAYIKKVKKEGKKVQIPNSIIEITIKKDTPAKEIGLLDEDDIFVNSTPSGAIPLEQFQQGPRYPEDDYDGGYVLPMYQRGDPLYQRGDPLYQRGDPLYQSGDPRNDPRSYQLGNPQNNQFYQSSDAFNGGNPYRRGQHESFNQIPLQQSSTGMNPRFQTSPESGRTGRTGRTGVKQEFMTTHPPPFENTRERMLKSFGNYRGVPEYLRNRELTPQEEWQMNRMFQDVGKQ